MLILFGMKLWYYIDDVLLFAWENAMDGDRAQFIRN